MTTELIISTVFITLALFFYSIGVWSERIARRLKYQHLFWFWSGFVCDTLGTGIMFEISGEIGFNIHSITGVTVIILMLIHAIWATVVLRIKNEKAIRNFHKFSIFVWLVWLIPYLNGIFIGMSQ
jgi:uncharacterized repeat protein (TIGR03987 family)